MTSRNDGPGPRPLIFREGTKGGKERAIPIRTTEQRALLKEIQALAGNGSLIPPHRSYINQLKLYEREIARAGICRAHGLRHLYAQRRYLELTGQAINLCTDQGELLKRVVISMCHQSINKLFLEPG